MKIVQPYAKIVSPALLVSSLSQIEAAARISHRSEEAQTDQSTERFIRAVVLQHGDWSVVEHITASVELYVDRGITHELVRHRLFSYTQESTRFVNYEKKMPPNFIYPQPGVVCPRCANGDEPRLDNREIICHVARGESSEHNMDCSYAQDWLLAIDESETRYKSLLGGGWRPQEARSVLPNALGSKILMTGNLRNWRHFFLMRTSKEAHPQMRQVIIPLLAEFQSAVPVLFEDIVPASRQVENIAKGR